MGLRPAGGEASGLPVHEPRPLSLLFMLLLPFPTWQRSLRGISQSRRSQREKKWFVLTQALNTSTCVHKAANPATLTKPPRRVRGGLSLNGRRQPHRCSEQRWEASRGNSSERHTRGTWPPPLDVPGTGSLVRNGSRCHQWVPGTEAGGLAVAGTSCSPLRGESSWLLARPHTPARAEGQQGQPPRGPGRKEAAHSPGAQAMFTSHSGHSGVQQGPPYVRCAGHRLSSHRVLPRP